jgi:hypothetical protein
MFLGSQTATAAATLSFLDSIPQWLHSPLTLLIQALAALLYALAWRLTRTGPAPKIPKLWKPSLTAPVKAPESEQGAE